MGEPLLDTPTSVLVPDRGTLWQSIGANITRLVTKAGKANDLAALQVYEGATRGAETQVFTLLDISEGTGQEAKHSYYPLAYTPGDRPVIYACGPDGHLFQVHMWPDSGEKKIMSVNALSIKDHGGQARRLHELLGEVAGDTTIRMDDPVRLTDGRKYTVTQLNIVETDTQEQTLERVSAALSYLS